MVVEFKLTRPDAKAPTQAHQGDAGWDLYSVGKSNLAKGQWATLMLGITVAPPPNVYFRLVGRSSAMWVNGIQVVEGVIDSGFRGELMVLLRNTGMKHNMITIMPGQRVAQLIPHMVGNIAWEEVVELPDSDRGDNGFGSTGK